ncbi:MAG: hypothetical protein IH855_02390 [Bacteroidetes bacterium]|nr:hypothetical protein [Bacteroidota bacterium]
MQKYFRSLATPGHDNHFDGGKRYSSHHATPGAWIQIFTDTGSANEEDYPLDHPDGPSTSEARRAFINAISDHGDRADASFTLEELEAVGQVQGLFAFRTPQDAIEYSNENVYTRSGKDRYVVLTGKVVGTAVEDRSVVIADHRLVDGPMSRADLLASYSEEAESESSSSYE